jgi:DNA-binding Xre family transcriptional regulator
MRLGRHDRTEPPGGAGRVSTDDVEYELARLPRDVTTAITWYMKEHQLTKSELARRLGVTPGRVSQILSGDENLTLRTLATVCAALDAHLTVDLVPNAGGGANEAGLGGFGVSHVAS